MYDIMICRDFASICYYDMPRLCKYVILWYAATLQICDITIRRKATFKKVEVWKNGWITVKTMLPFLSRWHEPCVLYLWLLVEYSETEVGKTCKIQKDNVSVEGFTSCSVWVHAPGSFPKLAHLGLVSPNGSDISNDNILLTGPLTHLLTCLALLHFSLLLSWTRTF